jgi:SH3-like domain-containing protein
MRGMPTMIWGLAVIFLVAGCDRKKKSAAKMDGAPAPVAAPVKPRPPAIVAFRPDDAPPLGVRFAADDRTDVRLGPSRSYPEIQDANLQSGQRLFVLDETNAWIRVRTTDAPGPALGWINKFASLPALDADTDLSAQTADVELMRKIGLLMEVSPERNEAVVHTNIWNAQSLVVRRGMGRSLAFYCGLTKGSNTRWVQINDSGTGLRIAKYSDNTGFTDFSSLRTAPGR